MSRNKITTATIALLLMATITVSIIYLPVAIARMWPEPIPTWTYIGLSPETVSTNQQVIIVFWSNFIPPTAVGAYGDRWTFWVDIEKPDGSEETLGPYTSDPVGGSWCVYTPDQIGTYTFVARMDEHTIDGGASTGMENPSGPVSWPSTPSNRSLGDVFQASESDPMYLTVQEDPLWYYQETPLPEYWERPVYGANHDWGKIMGDWLNNGDIHQRTNHYSTAPGSSHILWATPYWSGGVIGGGANYNFGPIGYYSGLSYENYGGIDFVLDGRVYYSDEINPRNGWTALDLYTGEVVFQEYNTGDPSGVGGPFSSTGEVPYGDPDMGQLLDIENPNQHGGFAYFWDTNPGMPSTWAMYDAYSGDLICYVENIPSWTTSFSFFGAAPSYSSVGLDGSILRWHVENYGTSQNPDNYLQVFNTTHAIHYKEVYSSNSYWMWRPGVNATYDGNNGVFYNISIPEVESTSIRYVKEGEYIVLGDPGSNNGTEIEKGHWWCLSLEQGKVGELLWDTEFTPPAGLGDDALQWAQFSQHDMSYGGMDPELGIFWFELSMTRQRWMYDLGGQLLWVSDPEEQWAFYGLSDLTYNGNFYSYGYSGVLRCYDPNTGDIKWEWWAPFAGVGETAFGKTPLSLGAVADGKIYMYSSEHSPSQPLRRDAKIYCVDAETGELLWNIQCWPQNPVIAEGRLVTFDLFDHQVYCFGKGLSETTVEAPMTAVSAGSSVVIKGTVTDQSPGAPDTPAISDESMDDWMEYLYHQRPFPEDAKGVEVVITTLDPNGNTYELGRTTSNTNGEFGCVVDPPVPGKYEITAAFEGSESYASSCATTYLWVEEAPSPAQQMELEEPAEEPEEPTAPEEPEEPTEPEPTEPTEAPLLSTTDLAIIAAVAVAAIVGLVAYWQLRKRK